MIKFLILTLVFAVLNVNPVFNKMLLNCDYIVLDSSEKAKLIKDANNKLLFYEDRQIYEFGLDEELDLDYLDGIIYVTSLKNDKLSIYKFGRSGNLISVETKKGLFYKIKMFEYYGEIYLIGGIQKEKGDDIIINDYYIHPFIANITLSQIRVFETRDCYFKDILINSFELFLLGEKMEGESLEFGNSLGSFVCKLDEYFNILNYQNFSENICSFGLSASYITVLSNSSSFIFDYDLNLVLGLNFGLCYDFIYLSHNFKALGCKEDKLYLIDLRNGNILYETKFLGQIEVGKFLYVLYGEQIYLLDIIDESGFKDEISYGYMEYQDYLEGLYSYYYLESIDYLDGFNSLINGTYYANLTYTDLYGNKITKACKVIVEEECNVREGYIYPFGYNLKFTGIGILNGNTVYQNEMVKQKDNILELEGHDGAKRTIHFYGEDGQVSFSDSSVINYDYLAKSGETFEVKLKIPELDAIEILDVIVNGNEADFKIIDNLVIISLDVLDNMNYYYLEYIDYYSNGFYYVIPLYKLFKVFGTYNNLNMDISLISSSKEIEADIHCFDPKSELRFIEFKTNDGNIEISKKFVISSNYLDLSDLTYGKEYEYSISILSSDGINLIETEVFKGKMKYNKFTQMAVKIVKIEEDTKEFKIILEKNRGNGYIIFKSQMYKTSPTISKLSIALGVVMGISLAVFITYKRRRKFILKRK